MERRQVYGGGIFLAGAVLTGVQTVQGLQQSRRPIVFAFESAPFVVVALALAGLGLWVARQDTYEADLGRVVAWGIGSTILFLSVAALLLFSQQVTLGTLELAQPIAVNHMTVGAMVGLLVGLYDARTREQQRQLARERDRVETFANKAADVNNYGRALNRSRTVEEVSALCIEATQALLDLSEVAFVVADGDAFEIVNSTVVNADEPALRTVARESMDQDEATVVERDEPRQETRSVLVTMDGDTAVVLLAFPREETTVENEDVRLLELLVSHAATALDSMFEEPEAGPTP